MFTYIYIYICIYHIMYVYMSYIVDIMHPSLLLLGFCHLDYIFEKAKYFQACSNNKIALFFPFTAYCCL